MKVSIIMPVYNAEGTLQKSLDSLQTQTCHDIELVAVDDCSTDGSLELLNLFKAEGGIKTTVIHHERNMGVAAARNTGIDHATGEYICWLDADDTLAKDAIESMLKAGNEADIIGADWWLGFAKNARYMRQADYDTPLQALQNLMGGRMRWNLWMFMMKRSLFDGIRFMPGMNVGEDMYVTCSLFAKAKEIKQIHGAFYTYNAISETSISRQFSERKRMEIQCNLNALTEQLQRSEYCRELEYYIPYLKLNLKQPLLVTGEKQHFKMWQEWMVEANHKKAINPALPLRTRVLQRWAVNRSWMGIKLYYIVVYKFVYGIIFR